VLVEVVLIASIVCWLCSVVLLTSIDPLFKDKIVAYTALVELSTK